MKELLEFLGGTKTLTITNLILSVCIVFHLCCEFAHYIHEFISRRKESKLFKTNNKLLTEMSARIEAIEKTQKERGKCPHHKSEEEEKAHVDN